MKLEAAKSRLDHLGDKIADRFVTYQITLSEGDGEWQVNFDFSTKENAGMFLFSDKYLGGVIKQFERFSQNVDRRIG